MLLKLVYVIILKDIYFLQFLIMFFLQVIDDYVLPPNVEFSRGLEAHLTPCINFIKSCRLPAVSMNNAIKHIKWQLTQLPNTIAEYDVSLGLINSLCNNLID